MSTTLQGLPSPEVTPGFQTPLRIELGENGLWVLLEDLVWIGSDGDQLIVRAGEETDFASVPRFAQVLLPSADPRVVRAATVHDFMCREINEYHAAQVAPYAPIEDGYLTSAERSALFDKAAAMPKPAFSAVDADAIFEKIMADEGAGWWMRNVGWLGVRYGAAANAARRPGWLSTLPRVARLSTAFLALALAIVALVGWAYPW